MVRVAARRAQPQSVCALTALRSAHSIHRMAHFVAGCSLAMQAPQRATCLPINCMPSSASAWLLLTHAANGHAAAIALLGTARLLRPQPRLSSALPRAFDAMPGSSATP